MSSSNPGPLLRCHRHTEGPARRKKQGHRFLFSPSLRVRFKLISLSLTLFCAFCAHVIDRNLSVLASRSRLFRVPLRCRFSLKLPKVVKHAVVHQAGVLKGMLPNWPHSGRPAVVLCHNWRPSGPGLCLQALRPQPVHVLLN